MCSVIKIIKLTTIIVPVRFIFENQSRITRKNIYPSIAEHYNQTIVKKTRALPWSETALRSVYYKSNTERALNEGSTPAEMFYHRI